MSGALKGRWVSRGWRRGAAREQPAGTGARDEWDGAVSGSGCGGGRGQHWGG